MFSFGRTIGQAALLCSLVAAANAQFQQQGSFLFASGGTGNLYSQGYSVALSADGNTALVGAPIDDNYLGAAWVFTRAAGIWTQQAKLVGSGAVPGPSAPEQGVSVALSADGNTAVIGGPYDNNYIGAAWVFTRTGGIWSQQGSKLVATDFIGGPRQGESVAISADGNTILLSGGGDSVWGAAWVFTRSSGVWTQQTKLTADLQGGGGLGLAVALSADGNTALLCALSRYEAVDGFVFTRSGNIWIQQGAPLMPSDATFSALVNGLVLPSAALSADGNTALIGWPDDNQYLGASWVFTRTGNTWTQQGSKLVGSGWAMGPPGVIYQGISVALPGDGNTALIGGPLDGNFTGAGWVFQRSGGVWSQIGEKLVGVGAPFPDVQGTSVALSSDGHTGLLGMSGLGAYTFVSPKPSTVSLSSSLNSSLFDQPVTFTATVATGATGAVTFAIDSINQATVLLNGSHAQFTISNLSPGNHSVTASYSGDPTFAASSSGLKQTVTSLGVISLWANTVVTLGQSPRLPAILAKAAPPAGLTVYLTSSDPSKATVTPSVFVPGGRTSANTQPIVTGMNLGTVNITATALGYTPDTQPVRVTASLAFSRCCVTISRSATLNVVLNLSAPAPSGGLTVQLRSDNASIAAVPAMVTLSPHATSVNVPITGLAAGNTLIHASALPELADISIKVTVQ